ncbi:helicase-exonuclease AddAB subunit AddA [Loigolactobacillus jiayinensis]|uniref:ATP-dependent helicase/nuclease subunit A n=1 Tax=Loigolactobacillus jiayinensis TaxID=2486016 RepID=A0ABW1RBM8_9LACO|nr:helicase-exonuclease AddAB subunit AddA [Loigolactobacillus jiayinensis]
MSAKQTHFTTNQQHAIDDAGRNILVSASAGSGKTTVLVERVIQKILHKIDVDKLLIVTFTEAAASEMRERIQTALQQALINSDEPQQRQYLSQQLSQLPVAHISTLHAFCLQMIQRYYYVIDLDPVFRLLTDDTETVLLREDVWSDLREQLYQDQPAFAQLTANFSSDRSDDGLTDLVMRLYDFANANPEPDQWLAQLAQAYHLTTTEPTKGQFFEQQLLAILQEELTQAQQDLKSGQAVAEEQQLDKLVTCLDTDQQQVAALLAQLKTTSWNELRQQFLDFKWQRAPSLTKLDELAKAAKNTAMDFRKQAKTRVAALGTDYFGLTAEQLVHVMGQAEQLVKQLVEVVTSFGQAFRAEKQRRHLLDFSDLEHFTLAILTADNASGVQTRTALQQQFNEVLVDEYQDTNRLQEEILTTVAQAEPGNMFMVGDVKQSIYAFRLADPSLFLHKYNQFAQMDNPNQRIILAENFRSVANIDDFTNLVFSQLMDETVGEMVYDDSAKLVAGAKYPADTTVTAELLVYEADTATTDDDTAAVPEQFILDDKAQGQAALVGQRIQELMATGEIYDRKSGEKRKIRYQDIALLTPTRKNNLIIVDWFKRLGIPVVVTGAQSYFQTTEIQIMMALLSVVDNPYQDIPLVSVLRSPIVGLDENELAFLRINRRTGDYYQAVLDFQQNFLPIAAPEFQQKLYAKVDRFLGQLNQFRELARQNQLVTLIWTIYNETGFLDYVGGMPAGAQRQANLHALYERAHTYEASSFKGLFQFVRFIKQMQEKDKDLGEAPAKAITDAVSVMTIHGSKGLEFPVVFLMDATHQFNQANSRGQYVLDDRFGIGITYLDPEKRIEINLPQKKIAQTLTQRRQSAEEMRLLYVAITRTEQQLFVVGSYPNREKAIATWEKAFQSQHLVLNASLRSSVNNFMDWLGMCLIRHPKFEQQLLTQTNQFKGLDNDKTQFKVRFYSATDVLPAEMTTAVDKTNWPEKFALAAQQGDFTSLNVDQLDQVINLRYPFQAATETTAYQAVSEVKRLFDDPTNSEMNALIVDADEKTQGVHRYVAQDFAVPQFMQTTTQVPPTAVGTATHLVLQEIDLHTPPTAASITALIKRLVAKNILTNTVAEKIKTANILRFFDSDLGQQLLAQPDQLVREAPFSLLLPATQLFTDFAAEDPAQILIHGIMDGYLVTPEQVILFDYKTDYVPQTNAAAKVQQLKQRYAGQLNLYAAALSRILQRPVTHKYLYLLASGDLLAI